MSKTVAVFSSALLCLLFVSTASLRAQGTPPPDFTGVYSPIDPFGQAGRGRAAGAQPAAVPAPSSSPMGPVPWKRMTHSGCFHLNLENGSTRSGTS